MGRLAEQRGLSAEPRGHLGERSYDLARFLPDLGVCESQRCQPCDRVRLVELAVLRLLGGGAVVAQPVGLDDQAERGQ